MNNVAVNMDVCRYLFKTLLRVLLSLYTEMELLDYVVILVFFLFLFLFLFLFFGNSSFNVFEEHLYSL